MKEMNQLQAFRKRHKLTQVEACQELGYHIAAWRDYEQGRTKTPDHLKKHIGRYTELKSRQKQAITNKPRIEYK